LLCCQGKNGGLTDKPEKYTLLWQDPEVQKFIVVKTISQFFLI
jgi:hypothetical protein